MQAATVLPQHEEAATSRNTVFQATEAIVSAVTLAFGSAAVVLVTNAAFVRP